jgi:phosphoglycolate phosphatase
MLPMRYNLLVFDWDGTLMDSAPHIVACVQGAIAELGLESRDPEAIRGIIGLSLDVAIETLYPGADPAFHARFIDGYRHHYLESNPTPSTPFPGSEGLLAALDEAGYLLAIATGKSRRGLVRALDTTGFRRYFHASRCADDAPSKPHPGMLEQLMEELGAAPGATLMIGDTDFDLEMARNAGVDAVGVTYGAHPRERLAAAAPLALFDALGELLPWLGHDLLEAHA